MRGGEGKGYLKLKATQSNRRNLNFIQWIPACKYLNFDPKKCLHYVSIVKSHSFASLPPPPPNIFLVNNNLVDDVEYLDIVPLISINTPLPPSHIINTNTPQHIINTYNVINTTPISQNINRGSRVCQKNL